MQGLGFQFSEANPTTGNPITGSTFTGNIDYLNGPSFTTTPPTTPSVSDTSDEPATLTLNATIRDFHPDLPSSFQTGATGVITGIVSNTLGTDGKPTLASPAQAVPANIDPATFTYW